MNIKLLIGRAINNAIERMIIYNYRLVPFIPTGRFLALDLKRAGLQVDTIFDVGANYGQTALYFAKNFTNAQIHSFEPVKDTYKQLIKNVVGKGISTHNIGLGKHQEQLTIHKNNFSGSSSLKDNDGRFFSSELVNISTGKVFCYENGVTAIDILKMDVEGHELSVLEGFGNLLETSVKFIYTEIGFDPTDPYKTFIGDLLNILTNKGFIISGFYEPYRWDKGNLRVFYNVLLFNTNLVNV